MDPRSRPPNADVAGRSAWWGRPDEGSMKRAMDIEALLQWRSERAEAEAPQAPSGVSLLKLVSPWWEVWPDRFAASVRRLASIQLSYGYAMSHAPQGHSGHPVAALISEG